MAKGMFELVGRDPNNDRDIYFQVRSGLGEESDDQLQLKGEIEQAQTVIDVIFPNDSRSEAFNRYIDQLVSLARTGLVGDSANPRRSNH